MANNSNILLRFVKRYINMEQCLVLKNLECDLKIVNEIKKNLNLIEINYKNKNIDLLEHIPSNKFLNLSKHLSTKFINPFVDYTPYKTDIIYLQKLIDNQKIDKNLTIFNPLNDNYENYDPFIAYNNHKYIIKNLNGDQITNLMDFYQNEIMKIENIKKNYKVKYDCKELEQYLINYANKKDHYLIISNNVSNNILSNNNIKQHIIEK